MLKKIAILVLAFALKINAQVNLVPNPSFESFSSCPDNWNQLNKAIGWTGIGSPDYFNNCSLPNTFSTPSNLIGKQYPASGNAYAGFIGFTSGGTGSEVLSVMLTSTLVPSQKYFVSFKVVFKYLSPWAICCAQNKLCMKFTKTQFDDFNLPPFNNSANFYSTQIISDTSNWTTVKGSFISDSAYKYLMIGNFFDNNNTSTLNVNPGQFNTNSYYFIDDVCVSQDSLTCFIVNRIDEKNSDEKYLIFPTIVVDKIKVLIDKNDLIELSIFDLLGKRIIHSPFTLQREYQLEFLENGSYILEIRMHDGAIFRRKIIKQ